MSTSHPSSRPSLRVQRRLMLGAALLSCLPALAAAAFPERPVTLIVPYPPGGTTDIAARNMAQAMQAHLGQTLVVENRAGAGGSIGMGALARAKPDGYTIAMGTIGTQSINQFLYKDLPFNPEKDFEPIAMVLTTPNVIAVSKDSPYRTLADLIADAKKRKDNPISYGSPGIGSSVHITGALLEQMAGIQMLHVPFKGVSASMPALIGGQIDVLLDNLPSSLSQVQSAERVRGLAVTSSEPAPAVPSIPTAAASGLPGFDATAWFALYAPRGLPAEARDKLIDSARKALATPELQASFVKLGAQAGTLFGKDLQAFEQKERERWGKLIKERNIQAQ